jgi:hypothetical protein
MLPSEHPFTVEIIADDERPTRFRWILFQGGKAIMRSRVSFSTKREAETIAAGALKRRVTAWRTSWQR